MAELGDILSSAGDGSEATDGVDIEMLGKGPGVMGPTPCSSCWCGTLAVVVILSCAHKAAQPRIA
jgi:hypothetical protein